MVDGATRIHEDANWIIERLMREVDGLKEARRYDKIVLEGTQREIERLREEVGSLKYANEQHAYLWNAVEEKDEADQIIATLRARLERAVELGDEEKHYLVVKALHGTISERLQFLSDERFNALMFKLDGPGHIAKLKGEES